jgi:hypothetical protein
MTLTPTNKLLLKLTRKYGVGDIYKRLKRYKGFGYISVIDVGQWATSQRTPTDEQIKLLDRVLPLIQARLKAAERKSLPDPAGNSRVF